MHKLPWFKRMTAIEKQEFCIRMAEALHAEFPWLGTDVDVSGCDTIDALNELHDSLSTGGIR